MPSAESPRTFRRAPARIWGIPHAYSTRNYKRWQSRRSSLFILATSYPFPCLLVYLYTYVPSPMRILLFGDIGGEYHYHVGDEAMFTAALDYLRAAFPRAEFVVASKTPEHTARVHGIPAVRRAFYHRRPLKSLAYYLFLLFNLVAKKLYRRTVSLSAFPSPQIIDEIAAADFVLFTGGGNLENASSLRGEFMLNILVFLWIIHRFRKPVAFVSQGIGPFQRRTLFQRILLRAACRLLNHPNVRLITVRERLYSAQALAALGVARPRVAFAPDDAVFLAPPPQSEVSRQVSELGLQDFSSAIGLSLHSSLLQDLTYWQEVLDQVTEVTRSSLLFLPHTYPGNDHAVAESLVARLAHPERARVAPPSLLDREVKSLTTMCGMVVASRYHAAVFALSAGVPVIAIHQDEYYYQKLEGLFELFHCPTVLLHPASLRADQLALRILDAWGSRDTLRPHLQRSARAVEELPSNRELLSAILSSSSMFGCG